MKWDELLDKARQINESVPFDIGAALLSDLVGLYKTLGDDDHYSVAYASMLLAHAAMALSLCPTGQLQPATASVSPSIITTLSLIREAAQDLEKRLRGTGAPCTDLAEKLVSYALSVGLSQGEAPEDMYKLASYYLSVLSVVGSISYDDTLEDCHE